MMRNEAFGLSGTPAPTEFVCIAVKIVGDGVLDVPLSGKEISI